MRSDIGRASTSQTTRVRCARSRNSSARPRTLESQAYPNFATLFVAGGKHAVMRADQVAGVRIVLDPPDRVRRGATQVACGLVRRMVEIVERALHAFARVLAHRSFMVDDASDCLQSNVRASLGTPDRGSVHRNFPFDSLRHRECLKPMDRLLTELDLQQRAEVVAHVIRARSMLQSDPGSRGRAPGDLDRFNPRSQAMT